MKKQVIKRTTQLEINEAVVGDSMEIQMERIMNNGELDGMDQKEIKYTAKEDGVIAITDIRADKFELALEQNNKILEDQKGRLEKKRQEREEKLKESKEKSEGKDSADGVAGQSVDATS